MKYPQAPYIMSTNYDQENKSQSLTFLLTHKKCQCFLYLLISSNFFTVEMNLCLILLTCLAIAFVDTKQHKTVRGIGDRLIGIQYTNVSNNGLHLESEKKIGTQLLLPIYFWN